MNRAKMPVTTLVLLLLTFTLTSCVTMSAGSDYYPEADFTGYREYVWMEGSPIIRPASSRVDISALTVRRIREAIEAELLRSGFEQATAASPENTDFAISFTVGARDMISVEDYPRYYRGSWQWRPPYYWPNVDVSMYTEGTLAIDIFDNESRQPVWHGWARKRITGSDIEDPESAINEAVQAILAEFPPRGT